MHCPDNWLIRCSRFTVISQFDSVNTVSWNKVSLKKEHFIIIENNIIRVVAVIKLASGLGLMALKNRHVKRVRITTNVLSASEK